MTLTLSGDSLQGHLYFWTQFFCYLQCRILAVVLGDPPHVYTHSFYWQKLINAMTTSAYLNITIFIQQNFFQCPPAEESTSALPFAQTFTVPPDSWQIASLLHNPCCGVNHQDIVPYLH